MLVQGKKHWERVRRALEKVVRRRSVDGRRVHEPRDRRDAVLEAPDCALTVQLGDRDVTGKPCHIRPAALHIAQPSAVLQRNPRLLVAELRGSTLDITGWDQFSIASVPFELVE
jgi:hypothetical protein